MRYASLHCWPQVCPKRGYWHKPNLYLAARMRPERPAKAAEQLYAFPAHAAVEGEQAAQTGPSKQPFKAAIQSVCPEQPFKAVPPSSPRAICQPVPIPVSVPPPPALALPIQKCRSKPPLAALPSPARVEGERRTPLRSRRRQQKQMATAGMGWVLKDVVQTAGPKTPLTGASPRGLAPTCPHAHPHPHGRAGARVGAGGRACVGVRA